MAAGEDRDEHLLDHFVLSDDHFRQFVAEAAVGLFATLHGSNVVSGRGGKRGGNCGGHWDLQGGLGTGDWGLEVRTPSRQPLARYQSPASSPQPLSSYFSMFSKYFFKRSSY